VRFITSSARRSRPGYGPTVREIGNEFGIKSPNGVMCHLKALQKKGLIHREANMSRAIQLLQDTPSGRPSSLKLLGRIAAGQPLEAIEEAEDFGFEDWEDPDHKFVLQVTGESMIEAHIADGDYVIIRSRNRPATARSSPCGRGGGRHPQEVLPRAQPRAPGAGEQGHEADLPRQRDHPRHAGGSRAKVLKSDPGGPGRVKRAPRDDPPRRVRWAVFFANLRSGSIDG
jgi:hypothetical protein